MPKKLRERRRRGDGGVFVAKYDKNGKPILWKASISLGVVTIDGKRRRNRPTEYAESEKEAHDLLKRMQARYLAGDDMTPSKQTVEAFLLRWLEHVKAVNSPGTYQVYESRCRVHMIPTIGGIKLRSLKTAHVQTMLDVLADKLGPSTVKDIRGILIKALNDARKWGEVKQNVAVDTEIRPVIETRRPSLTEAQLGRLLEVISGDPMELLILVALSTGARIGECLALLWANIAEDDHELHIMGKLRRQRRDGTHPGAQYELVRDAYTKARDQRTTHLPTPATEIFRRQWQQQQQWRQEAGRAWVERGFVFTDKYGHPLDPSYMSRRFQVIAKRAGLPPDFTFHCLRHSCATFLIKQGETQRTVAVVLGHKNLRTTARYGEVLPEVTRDALDKHAERLTRRRGVK